MQPLDELLSRIKWDAEFGKGSFALGYDDHVAHREQRVDFEQVTIDPERPGMLLITGDDGVASIPFHRVRTVYRNGAVIWRRPRQVGS